MAKSAFIREVENYVGETLHTPIRMTAMANTRQLPVYLTSDYALYDVQFGALKLAFMVRKDDAGTPAQIAKHVSQVRSKLFNITIFVTESLTAKNRSRLIKDGIPFIVPGNQLYIPELAMDLREHFRAQKVKAGEALTPVAQAVLFHHLLGVRKRAVKASDIAASLNYTPMSIGRSFDVLEGLELATSVKIGRERHIQFELEGADLFDRAKSMLRSPVRSLRYLTGKQRWEGFKLAGESALAKLTSLSPPEISHYATTLENWTVVQEAEEIEEVHPEEADTILEIWSYDPAPLTGKWTIDPLSLYAQFWDHPDERVAMAAEAALEEVKW